MTEKKSGPNIVKLVIVLTLVSAVVAAILGGVNAMLTVCALSGCIGLCFGIAAVRCGNKR